MIQNLITVKIRRRIRCSVLFALILSISLATLVALRGDTRDTEVYIRVFLDTDYFPFDPIEYYRYTGMEWAFGIISWLFKEIGLGYVALFFLVSLLTFIFIEKAAKQLDLRLVDVLPYYLGSFFLLQQLMTIRQGLGVAFAISIVVSNIVRSSRASRVLTGTLIAMMVHLVSVVPILVGQLLQEILPNPSRRRLITWVLVLVFVSAAAARLVTFMQLVVAMDRLAGYATDAEFGGRRSLFEFANIRAAVILCAVMLCPVVLLRSRAYLLLAGMYAAHLGLRLGFYDFAILSGRLAVSLGFVEVFLMPLLVRAAIREQWLRWLIGILYLAVHAFATLTIQAPYLIDDYLTPLHSNYAAS